MACEDRQASDTIRYNLERSANARQAFSNAIQASLYEGMRRTREMAGSTGSRVSESAGSGIGSVVAVAAALFIGFGLWTQRSTTSDHPSHEHRAQTARLTPSPNRTDPLPRHADFRALPARKDVRARMGQPVSLGVALSVSKISLGQPLSLVVHPDRTENVDAFFQAKLFLQNESGRQSLEVADLRGFGENLITMPEGLRPGNYRLIVEGLNGWQAQGAPLKFEVVDPVAERAKYAKFGLRGF